MNHWLVRWIGSQRPFTAGRELGGRELGGRELGGRELGGREVGGRHEVARAPGPADVVTIAMGFDGNYAPHVAAVLASVVAHAPGARFRFIMLHVEVPEPIKRKLERVAPGSEFVWREVGDEDVPAFEDRAHLTRATLFRLGLEKLAPADCHRVIYLDTDLIVTGDIRRLWESDLGDAPVAGVRDETIDADAFAARWGLSPGPDYFNAGVLVIDLDRVRAGRVFAAATEFLAAHDPVLTFCDQDALNWACWGRWRQLDLVWNVQRTSAIEYAIGARDRFGGKAPRIVHYTCKEKPWILAGYHPWAWLYWQALARTEMFDTVAASQGLSGLRLFQLWLRWMRKRPRAAPAERPHDRTIVSGRPGLAST